MNNLILLASGFGNRYGSNKLMAEIDGKKMYLHILERLKDIRDNRTDSYVTVVSQYEEILDKAKEYNMAAVYNGDAEEGIAASIRLGTCELSDSGWFFFFTADQPYLTASTIDGFITAVTGSGRSMASVCNMGIPGSPTAFSNIWKKELLGLKGDTGGRIILKSHPDEVFWYEINSFEIRDIDYND